MNEQKNQHEFKLISMKLGTILPCVLRHMAAAALFILLLGPHRSVAAEIATGAPDAFLDYVEATGSQWIDTGVQAATGLKARLDLEISSAADTDVDYLGARTGERRFFMLHSYENSGHPGKSPYIAYGDGDNAKYWDWTFKWPLDTRFEYLVDYTDGAAIEYSVNATNRIPTDTKRVKMEATPRKDGEITSDDMGGLTLYLFAANYAGTASWPGAGRLYEAKIMRKNSSTGELELLRHYLPCRKDGRAGLYDTVSDTVFFSRGSADFAAGPELPRPVALVSYVESDGSKLSVDTHVIGKIGLKSEVDATLLENSGDRAILASRGLGASTNFRLYLAYHYNGYFCYGDGPLHQPKTVKPVAGTRYLIESELSTTVQSVKIDGTELNADSTEIDYFSTGVTLHLFANNHAGAFVKTQAKARLHSAKIWDGDELLRDFVPCVADDGEAGLYDAVSRRVFKPTGGAFNLETQVGGVTRVLVAEAKPTTRLEYVYSDGASDYVDLGVIGKDGVEMDALMEWLEVPSDGAFVGARNANPIVRFFPYHHWQKSGQNSHRIGYGASLFGGSSDGDATLVASAGRQYRIRSRLDYGDCYLSVQYQDGDAWAWESVPGGRSIADTDDPVDTGLPLYLFAVNNDGTPAYFGKSRVRSLKLRVKGKDGQYAPARDLVPVRDPLTGGAALWDRVSETYLRNGGRWLLSGGGTERPLEIPFVLILR